MDVTGWFSANARREAGDHRKPGQGQGEQDQDTGDREPRQHARLRAKSHDEGDGHDDHERHQNGDQRGQHVRPQYGRPSDPHGVEALEDAALHVEEEPVCGVGDARSNRDEKNPGQ